MLKANLDHLSIGRTSDSRVQVVTAHDKIKRVNSHTFMTLLIYVGVCIVCYKNLNHLIEANSVNLLYVLFSHQGFSTLPFSL